MFDVETIGLAFMTDVGYQTCLKLKISHSIILYNSYLYIFINLLQTLRTGRPVASSSWKSDNVPLSKVVLYESNFVQ